MQTKRSLIILHPKSSVKILSVITIFLVLANLFTIFVIYITGDRNFYGLIPLFKLNIEYNIPSFFSGCLFLGSAVLLILIWKAKKMNDEPQIIWALLSVIFFYLGVEILLNVHGLLIEPIRKSLGISRRFYFVYGLGLLILLLVFIPVWRQLNKNVKQWFALSASTFLSGAIGFDVIGDVYFKSIGWREDLIYSVLYTIEESLEMAGLIMFIYGLLLLLRRSSTDYNRNFR